MKKHWMMVLSVLLLLVTAAAQAQSYPATDSFSGTGALSANWTSTTAYGTTFVALAQSSGKVVPSTSGSQGMATYTGITINNDQYSQAVFVTHSTGGGTGPCVRMGTNGNGVCWLADSGALYAVYNGAYFGASIAPSCPVPASGDTIKLSVVGTTYTCADVTTSTSSSGTDTNYSSGAPGIRVDQGGSTSYALASFQTDCIPTCSLGTVATPTFSPAAGTYGSTQSVTISTTTSGATIHYTTDGSTPTTSSATYSSPISVSVSETIKAMAAKASYTNSAVGSAAYVISLVAATPTFSPAAGSYSTAQTVTISDSTSGATIHYTTDGSTPTSGSATYSSAISVAVSETVKAIAIKTGYTNSAVGSAAYTLTAVTPTFSPAAGSYTSIQTVTISSTTSGAVIHYTTDGTTPTSGSTTYSSPITVATSETVKAIAVKTGWTNSGVGSAAYTITLTAATPTFSPGAGSYTSIQTVTISSATSGATIYYTTNGTTPTTGSTVYASAISVGVTETVKAIAAKTGYTTSAVGSAAYTITLGGMYPVTDSLAGTGALSASWTNTSAGALMSHPFVPLVRSSGNAVPNTSASAGLATYTGATFTADQYAQVKFVTHSTGSQTGPCVEMNTGGTGYCYMADEGAVVALYVGTNNGSAGISCPVPASGDTIKLAIAGTTLTCTDVTAGTSASGSTISGFYTSGNPGMLVDQLTISSYALNTFQADCVPTCVVPVTPTFSPAAGTYGSAQTVTISTTTPSATIYYTTNGTTPTTSSSTYSSPITVAYTQTVQAVATAPGDVLSAVGSAAYVLTVATPTFSPGAGSYSTAQTVTISSATAGATIYYTTNGTTPTTSSPVYSAPITVASSETVKALATLSGSPDSAVGSAAYVLQVATPTFSPIAGAYLSTQTVTISTTTPSATIYYTTNGTTPTTSSTVYSSPLSISTSKTVKAIATVASGYSQSLVGSALYTIGKTLSSVGISPWGGAIQTGSTLQFSVTCTYSDSSTDDCTAAGGATWRTSSVGAANTSVNSSGLVTRVTDPGAGNVASNFVIVTAGGISDKAEVFAQHVGDTWYQYPTPDYRVFKNWAGTTVPLTVAVGSTVTMGTAINPSDPNPYVTDRPFQSACNWTTSNASIATVDRHGQITGVAPGSVTITCAVPGNAVFGSSAQSGWISPGNTLALSIVAGGTSNTTWYVRPDGGTLYNATTNPTGQCNGQANAAYSGSGTNQACAVAKFRDLWDDNYTYYYGTWVISGGDTVIVAQNSAGYDVGGDSGGGPVNCNGDPYGCFMPSIPSGTATRHTKLLGANYASCHADSSKTLLHVTYGAGAAFNVRDSQFVDVACFEVTDEAACAHPYTNNPCNGSTPNNGAYGIQESALTGSVNYTDLFIHGLNSGAIYGATGVGVVADHLHLRANGLAAITMDDIPWLSGNISVSGGFTLTNSITEFTGCVEEYPVVHSYPYIECQDQGSNGSYGYGDGFGTASTTGNWIFDHDTWRYNWQDGLDLLHSGMQDLTVTNSLSMGNEGQAYKIGSGDTVIFQNNIAMVNCQRMSELIGDEPASALYPGESSPGTLPALGPGPNGSYSFCRAAGDWTVFNFTDIGSYKIQDNTFVGYGLTPFDMNCEGGWEFCSDAKSAFQNNVVMGYSNPAYQTGTLPGLFYLESPNMAANDGWAVRDHNLYYNIKSGNCPSPLQTGETCNTSSPGFTSQPTSPISAETDLDGFNFTPASGSPLVGAGIAIPGITMDYNGTTRPNPPAIGAIQ